MKAGVISAAKRPIEVVERSRPKPGVGEMLIRVEACGICHSDLAVREGQFPFAKYPIVPGHEVAGVVEELGEGVSWPAKGARVGMAWLYSSCGHCDFCVRGDEILCPLVRVTGVNVDGGFQEYMIAPAAYAAPLPENIGAADVAPLMCAGLTVYNGLRRAGFQPGNRVAVIGLGGLGHMGVLFAKAMGGRVAVLSTSNDKAEQAKALGAELFINTKEQDAVKSLQAWEGGANVILATAPSAKSMSQSFAGLAGDGTMVVCGASADGVEISTMDLIAQRRRLIGTASGSRHDLRDALNVASKLHVLPEITKVSLEQANETLDQMSAGKVQGRAVITF